MHDGLKDTDLPEGRRPAAKNERLQTALANRERFLEKNPHLRDYQVEIDRLLDGSGNSDGRIAVLGTLMQGKLLELQKELKSLSQILQETNAERS